MSGADSELAGCNLPDPRRYGAGAPPHPLNRLSAQPLRSALERALAERRDADIEDALHAAPTREAHFQLWNAVCAAAHAADPGPAAASTRIFALPLVLVTGSRRPAVLPGVLPDIAAVSALFGQYGVLGRTSNFGFTNALCGLETLEGVKPGEVYAWTHASAHAPRELAPDPIILAGLGEEVHLRFLVGAGIVGAAEPSFVETASNIGAWGMPLTRALAGQLAADAVEMLPLPRPPIELLRASHAGPCAQLEAALNVGVTNEIRRFRASVGDPVAIVSVHDDGDLRLSLSSQFEDTLHEGFRWPLHALDDIAQIVGDMAQLLAACRVADVNYVNRILPAHDAKGQTWFPQVRELDLLARESSH